MDGFFDRLIVRAATIDELLSDAFEPIPGQKSDTDLATRRLAAWCRSCASGDWSLFNRRLERDGLSFAEVLARFATVRRNPSAPTPKWIGDAIWIDNALQHPHTDDFAVTSALEPLAFERLLTPIVEQADTMLRLEVGECASANLSLSAQADLRRILLKALSDVFATALYERFGNARKAAALTDADTLLREGSTSYYDRFAADMKAGGFHRLFQEKPVLLRLAATITRQWIDTTLEFTVRLNADLLKIRHDILRDDTNHRVAGIEGDLSDSHNGGHSVLIVRFEDDASVVYKPKDLRLDVAWHALVERLNCSGTPIELKTARAIARDGYGWTEFINHSGCADGESLKRFFWRAGAWLALFHCFVGSDMHEENMIAAGEHPVPIDLEMILQATAMEHRTEGPEARAFEAAVEIVDNSVMMVGLLPIYQRSPDNKVFGMGGLTSDWNSSTNLSWRNINSDTMRPAKGKEAGTSIPNLPHIEGRYGKFGDHIDDLVAGFENYATFLLSKSRGIDQGGLFDDFLRLPVRKIVRPTSFYYILLQRLKSHHSMDDGVIWSAQADFLARLSDWERDSDPFWPLQKAERAALVTLNVPHFTSLSDGSEIRGASGISIPTTATSGFNRARARVRHFDERGIDWQKEVIRQNTATGLRFDGSAPVAAKGSRVLRVVTAVTPSAEIFLGEANKIAEDITRYAIRRGPAAAWIGLDWLGDSEVARLVPLGVDLYNGVSGIALFLAAHAAVTGSNASKELALAAVVHMRSILNSHNAPRMARSLGTGGAIGLGSIVYALTVMAKCLRDDTLLKDAHVAAELFSDDLIGADRRLDVLGGSAGGILSLLRLYHDSQSADVLERAVKCGVHLLAQPRHGENGGSWLGQGYYEQALNGMSHGAAGFAYALASLAAVTGRDEYSNAASQCVVFENTSYDALRNNWPEFRADAGPVWPCRWCHGASGVGIARAAMAKRCRLDPRLLAADVRNAISGVERGWPNHVDTLCCGTLGSIEFLCEAAAALGQDDLRELAAQRLVAVIRDAAASGDYRWDVGKRPFNVGLFRGLAGVGYTLLRQIDGTLPNVLIWE